jgi:putative ABC transport system permease protein
MIAAMLDQSKGELWVVPLGTKSFDDPSLLTGREKYAVLSTPGVESVEDLVVGFAKWRKPSGGSTTVLLVGSDWTTGGLAPWNISQGSLAALAAPNTVAVDDTYFADLGISGLGEAAEVNGTRVTIAALTHGIRSFTTLPYVFTSLTGARAYLGLDRHRATYVLVRLRPGAGLDAVRSALTPKLRQAEVLTTAEFRRRTIGHWLFGTGAGSALIAGAALGVLVGAVVVGQSLYAGTREHLPEFATLRALGSSAGYIHRVILAQAGLCAAIGAGCGALVGLLVVAVSAETAMPVVLTPALALLILGITVAMCCGGALSAIVKIVRLDPASVFAR